MMDQSTVDWRVLPVSVELDRLVAARAGWQVVRKECTEAPCYKPYYYALLDPDDDEVNTVFPLENEDDAEAILLLWEDTWKVRLSSNLNAAWDLLHRSNVPNFDLALEVISNTHSEANGGVAIVAIARIYDALWEQGDVVDYAMHEGIAAVTEPALAVVHAWLSWQEARDTPALEAVA
jgi:hypothetical protein